MRTILVQSPGLLTTVQDLGREGFGPLGVSPSGAADALALRIGNRLAGNPEGAAALEMTLLGGSFVFPGGAVAALAGSDFGATLDGAPAAMWTAFEARPGQTLRLTSTKTGARCYLCIQGGVAVDKFLGSASTHLLSGLGGFEGRALRKGDVLNIGDANSRIPLRSANPAVLAKLAPQKLLRVTDGPQSASFSADTLKVFYSQTYRVAEESNRMGLRLEGPPLPGVSHGEMLSEGVALGAIQITAGGSPIILFVEQQTTGGYPKIANVISADFGSLGQLRPRDEIRFERVTLKAALALLREQERLLTSKELIVE